MAFERPSSTMRRVIFCCLALLVALPHAGALGQRTRHRVRCTLHVQSPETPAARRSRGRAFSAREVADLRFDLWLLESQSSEPAEVRLYTPGGDLFKVLRVSAEEAPSSAGRTRLSRRGLSVLSARLPLVGTHITSRALYGEWRAEAYFVGSEELCTRPVEFVIQP